MEISKTKALIVVALILLAAIPIGSALKARRSCSDGWEIDKPCSAICDGNLDTYAQDKYNREVSVYTVNYYSPRGRVSDFEWTVWDSEGSETFSLEEEGCFSRRIKLRATHMKYTGHWDCWNKQNKEWTTLREFTGYELFEESGKWVVSKNRN